MAKQLTCNGLEELLKLLDEHKAVENIYILCSGAADPITGESWCPDCVKAEPVIEQGIKMMADAGSLVIHCSVGDRASWKDPQSPFRTHAKLKLKSVPTLLKWNTPRRLGDAECSNQVLVDMFFEDE